MTAAGRRGLTLLLAWLVAMLSTVLVWAQPRPVVVVRDVTVEGNRRVQEAVILGRVQTRIGSPFSPSVLSEDLRAIFALGFFDDVRTRVEDFEGGLRVTFVVVERPFVRDVAFTGNKKLATADLLEKITLKLGSVYNPVEVQRAVDRLRDHYEQEGYYEVRITPGTETFPDGDVRVTFTVEEGRRITIDEIVITGNAGLTARQIKGVLGTQERQYFILRGTVQRQQLDEDVDRILALYNDHGYIQARVESTDVQVDQERARVRITFAVVEGPQFRVGEIVVSGNSVLPESEIRRQLLLRAGDVFSRGKLRDSLRQIADLYSSVGRASADVVPRTEQNQATATVNVTLDINEGPEVYVERINISGNVRSQDKILRREIPFVEGDLFTLQKLQRARQRLVNLGYFETVNITTQPGADRTRIVVNVEVTERPTGLFSVGAGFSSVDALVGTIDLSQRNFMGRGWELTLRLRLGANVQQGIISFTEPWLFDRPLAAGFDLFRTQRVYDEFDYATTGGNLRLSRPFAEYWRWSTSYRLTYDEVSDVDDDADDELKDEEGGTITSAVSGGLTRDTRDNVFAPTRGSLLSLRSDVAGLGGDARFVKLVGSYGHFLPIWFGHILATRGEAGWATGWGGEDVPIFERYFLGGPNSLRGWKYRQVSPEDDEGDPIGGTGMLLGNVEYVVPLPYNLRLAAFFDIGNVYGKGVKFDPTDVRYDAGAGFRWLSPFGPIRVDYGWKLCCRGGKDAGVFHFAVGSPF